MQASLFSLSHDWSLHWVRLPSNFKRLEYFNGESSKEERAINALASVGVIGGQQLFKLFSLDRRRLRKMVNEQKIVRHEMKLGSRIIPIYTLGANGAVMTGIEDAYELNYWLEYKTEDVLKRVLFFELYHHFNFEDERNVLPAPKPFLGSIEFNGHLFYVYVVRGDINEFLMYLKWRESSFNKRMIVIAESLRHLESLKPSLEPFKIRLVLDQDLAKETEELQNYFYYLDKGEFIQDIG